MKRGCTAALLVASIGICPALAGDQPPGMVVGKLVSVPDSDVDGFIKRVSTAIPDGEDVRAGDILYGDDLIIMFHVVAWVEQCSQQSLHDALTERKTVLMPTDCMSPKAAPEDESGGIRAQLGPEGDDMGAQGLEVLLQQTRAEVEATLEALKESESTLAASEYASVTLDRWEKEEAFERARAEVLALIERLGSLQASLRNLEASANSPQPELQ